ncbi:MAG: polysaccharide biosynthesis/export family protein [Planctomycetota bacterium]|nr:polysaccharide biosynthesis/export family protein [Planctomycetota bacterium]
MRRSNRAACLVRSEGRAVRLLGTAAIAAALVGVAGCESDSFIDPSVIGRWEKTPTIVPILERIDVIERDTGEFVDVTPVMPEDLLPEVAEYRVGPGDGMVIIILDFYESGREARFEQLVDPRGYIALPQIGEVFINKLTRAEAERAIAQAIVDAGILSDPLVEVQVPGARQATFSIFGLVDRVGRYAVPGPDYRLLEAITDAGGVSPTIDKVYIIRQVSLGQPAKAAEAPTGTAGAPKVAPSPEQGESLIDLIEGLTEDEAQPRPADETAPPTPKSEIQTTPPSGDENLESLLEPESPAEDPPPATPGVLRRARPVSPAVMQSDPPIDLPDDDVPPRTLSGPPGTPGTPGTPAATNGMSSPAAGATPAVAGQGKWMFLNGEWVQVIQQGGSAGTGLPESDDPLKSADTASDVVTQRVIEVPVAPLIQGVAQYNLVIRAGDAISVPGPKQGFIYLTGPGVNRPGVYQLPFTGKLTLQRLIASAGGLSPIAIPERVDLIRMVGDDRQATIRLNLRAIAEGTQPDLFLKPDDLVNVGTNFWATPLAVVRGGLRASYGFGFLLDRNFGNDVFGAPPTDRFGN